MWSRTCGFTAYFIMKKRDDAPGGYGFKERLTLIRDGDAWLIVGIERLQDERHPLQRADVPAAGADGAGREPSIPFMNGRVYAAGSSPRSGRYEREAAAAYADRWWDSGNPEFEEFDVDCTNYISQCLFAGKAPIHYTGKEKRDGGTRGT